MIDKIQLTRAQIEPALTKGLPFISLLPGSFPELLVVGKSFLFWEYHSGGPTGRNFLAKVRSISHLKSSITVEEELPFLKGDVFVNFSKGDRILVYISARIANVVLADDGPDESETAKLGLYRDPTGIDFWVNCKEERPPAVLEGPFGNLYVLDSQAEIVKLSPEIRPGEFWLDNAGPQKKIQRSRGAYINVL